MESVGSPTVAASDDQWRSRLVHVSDASENNLRHVDLDVPRDAFVAFTGVSGSGKSSLAFGTIYAESQRRYLESVAPYARRLIQQVGAPHVGDITGLPMAIALQQRRGVPSQRTTVGTMTRLSNSLRLLFSRAGTYPAHTTERLDSDAFSPNTPAGACPTCQGQGRMHTVTEQSLVHDPTLTIREGAVTAWPGAWQGKNQRDILTTLGIDVDVPWRTLPQATRDWILFTDEQPVVTVHPVREPPHVQRPYQGTFMSARRYVLHTFAASGSERMRQRVAQFLVSTPCAACRGTGINPDALKVTFAGHPIDELIALPVAALDAVLEPTASLIHPRAAVARPDSGEVTEAAVALARDIRARIAVIRNLGLDYLSMSRTAPSLSAGELQRLRLAAQLRSGLFGVLYVLDEPSSGLHPSDTDKMVAALHELRAQGNSLFVVEHNMRVVRHADWIVDVGPDAGEQGGRILYSGPTEGLRAVTASRTRPYLFAGLRTPRASRRRVADGAIHLRGVRCHNLSDVDVDIPLGVLTVVTGVSGSGKSTLVGTVLPAALDSWLHPSRDAAPAARHSSRSDAAARDAVPVRFGSGTGTDRDQVSVSGAERVTRVVVVDQRPIGRTPRSTIATFTGAFDAIRTVFAHTPEATARGWSASRFSFNVKGGRCETCEGQGVVSVELLFLPGTYAPCPTCGGARYNSETLEVRWHGHSIADVLGVSVTDALPLFDAVPAVSGPLHALAEVGLGYARLGQPATELSGGEAQRVKLAAELRQARRGHTVYVLDEPTAGLHPRDVEVLMAQLQRLVDEGNTAVVVEHAPDVIREADHVIDLGPGGGSRGGRVVAQGTPDQIAADPHSVTGPYLR